MDGRSFSHFFRRSASALRQIIPALLVLGLFALGLPARAQSTGTAPDLVAENVSFSPPSVTLGTTPWGTQDLITLQATIRNKGTAATPRAMTVRVWASPDATVDGTGNDVLVASFKSPVLAPGATDDHTTAKNTAITIDPNFVGAYQNIFLQPGDYYLAVQVDAFDDVPAELDEHNFFTAPGTVHIAISTKPGGPDPVYECFPGQGTDVVSVSRDLDWTSSTFANRYNLSFARVKDLQQRFLPGYLIPSNPLMTKFWIADFGNCIDLDPEITYKSGYNPKTGYYIIPVGIHEGSAVGNGLTETARSYQDPGLDVLTIEDYKMQLYINKWSPPLGQPHPMFRDPMTIAATTTYSITTMPSLPARVVGSGFGGTPLYLRGAISAAVPANVNFFWKDDSHKNWTVFDGYMDVVFAEYLGLPDYIKDKNTGQWRWDNNNPPDNGYVYLATNISYIKPYVEPPNSLTTTFTQIRLHNKNEVTDVTYKPFGIKAVGAADLDDDGDVDIVAGSDRWANKGNVTKLVFWQSDFRNFPSPDSDANNHVNYWAQGIVPSFEPTDAGGIGQSIQDISDIAFGDFDGDGRMDIALTSYYENQCWVLHNKTDVGGDVRTTRTLAFDKIGPLSRLDNTGTTVPLLGATTICTSELYYRNAPNGTHKPDIIAGGYLDGKLVVYENRSTYSGDTMNPVFIPHTLNNFITPDLLTQIGVSTIDELTNLTKVVVSDMNGDGQPDIVACWATNDTVIWFENQIKDNFGQYVFKAHVATTKTNRVNWIAVADLNNDSLPDIATLSSYVDTPCQWFYNNPVFTSQNRVASNLLHPTYHPPQQMDFNTMYAWQVESWANDRYSSHTQMLIFRTQPTRYLIYPSLGLYNQVEPRSQVNVNLDIVVDGPQPVYGSGIAAIADAVLDRKFSTVSPPVMYGTPPRIYDWWVVGFYDFLRSFLPGQTARISVNFPTISTIPEGYYNFWVYAAGRTPTYLDGVRNGILDGVGDGFDGVQPWRVDQQFTDPSYGDDCYIAKEKFAVCYKPGLPITPFPLNNAINIPTSTNLSWTTTSYTTGYDVFLAKASNAWPTYTSTTVSLAVPMATSIATGDIDNDGQVDLATSYYTAGWGHVAWMKNQSTGRAYRTLDIAGDLHGPADVSIANLDSDTRPDVLAASPADFKIRWYRNLGVGSGGLTTFGPGNDISAQAVGVNTARPVDLNNDGKIDVVAAMSGIKRLCWFENTGTPAWTEHSIDTQNGLPLYAIPADVNGDGFTDLIVASASPNSVAWYENKGGANPTFVRHVIDTSSSNVPKWLAVGDINGDGGLDIVALSVDASLKGTITWYESDRSFPPNFTPHVVVSGVSGLHNLVVTDYNHDAKPDIITAIDNGNRVLFFANNGGTPLTFTQFTVNSQVATIGALAAADVDVDTFPEVISANAAGGMYWFDYVMNFQYGNQLAKLNPLTLSVAPPSPLGIANSRVTWSSLPNILEPSQGYKWQTAAKRQIPIYGGTYERVTSSTVWSFQTSQCDLSALSLSLSTRSVSQGKHFQVTVTEANIGLSDAAPHLTEIWASTSPNFTRGSTNIYLGSIYMPSIPAGGRASGTLDVNTAATGLQGNLTMAMGYYYIGCFVNANSAENSESRKDNNFTYNTGRLQITHGTGVQSWRGYR